MITAGTVIATIGGWYYNTRQNSKDIESLKKEKVSKELYNEQMAGHIAQEQRLETAILDLTKSIRDLELQFASFNGSRRK